MGEFIVIGADGKEYGPVGFSTLQQWVNDNRVNANSVLKDPQSGATMLASTLPSLFPPAVASSIDHGVPPQQPTVSYSQYPRVGNQMGNSSNRFYRFGLSGVIFRCVMAIIIASVWHGIGFISAIYAAYYTFRAKKMDHEHANIMIGLVIVTFIVVSIFAFALPSSHGIAY